MNDFWTIVGRRLRTNSVRTENIVGVDPSEDVTIVTLFDTDDKKRCTFVQAPSTYTQQTQGESGRSRRLHWKRTASVSIYDIAHTYTL